jgi:hypothetical protein
VLNSFIFPRKVVGGPGDLVLPDFDGDGGDVGRLDPPREGLAKDTREMLDAGVEAGELRQIVEGLVPKIGRSTSTMSTR